MSSPQPQAVRGATILLSTGRYFDFTAPRALSIVEIAHGLSHICRFTGHCYEFYSVAQHSVLVSHLVPERYALHGLLHDAVEAVVGDMASPLKALIPEYKEIERQCEAVILRGFGLDGLMPPEVKHADLVALRTEQRDLMGADTHLWTPTEGLEPHPERISPLIPQMARRAFLHRYLSLTSRRVDAATEC